MTHLDTSNTSYGQKKGQKSNWQIDSRPLKVRNCLKFLACRWCATYLWKALNKAYNFASDLISIKGFHAKLWVVKVVRVPLVGILGLPFERPKTKWHLGAGPMARHRVYYKGEGGGFPKSKPRWVLWIQVCPWHQKCFNFALTNLLFSFVQVRVSEWLLVILPSPILELQHTPLPPKCCEPGNVPQLLTFMLFSL